MSDIREFRITWKREVFFKNKSTLRAAKYLMKKSIHIARKRSSYQVNNLTSVHQSNKSLAEYLQQRLQSLQNEIENYNHQIKNLTEQENDYWKRLAEIIDKRTNLHQQPKSKQTSSNTRSIVKHIDKNNENIPPLEYTEYDMKVPKIRKKKKCIS